MKPVQKKTPSERWRNLKELSSKKKLPQLKGQSQDKPNTYLNDVNSGQRTIPLLESNQRSETGGQNNNSQRVSGKKTNSIRSEDDVLSDNELDSSVGIGLAAVRGVNVGDAKGLQRPEKPGVPDSTPVQPDHNANNIRWGAAEDVGCATIDLSSVSGAGANIVVDGTDEGEGKAVVTGGLMSAGVRSVDHQDDSDDDNLFGIGQVSPDINASLPTGFIAQLKKGQDNGGGERPVNGSVHGAIDAAMGKVDKAVKKIFHAGGLATGLGQPVHNRNLPTGNNSTPGSSVAGSFGGSPAGGVAHVGGHIQHVLKQKKQTEIKTGLKDLKKTLVDHSPNKSSKVPEGQYNSQVSYHMALTPLISDDGGETPTSGNAISPRGNLTVTGAPLMSPLVMTGAGLTAASSHYGSTLGTIAPGQQGGVPSTLVVAPGGSANSANSSAFMTSSGIGASGVGDSFLGSMALSGVFPESGESGGVKLNSEVSGGMQQNVPRDNVPRDINLVEMFAEQNRQKRDAKDAAKKLLQTRVALEIDDDKKKKDSSGGATRKVRSSFWGGGDESSGPNSSKKREKLGNGGSFHGGSINGVNVPQDALEALRATGNFDRFHKSRTDDISSSVKSSSGGMIGRMSMEGMSKVEIDNNMMAALSDYLDAIDFVDHDGRYLVETPLSWNVLTERDDLFYREYMNSCFLAFDYARISEGNLINPNEKSLAVGDVHHAEEVERRRNFISEKGKKHTEKKHTENTHEEKAHGYHHGHQQDAMMSKVAKRVTRIINVIAPKDSSSIRNNKDSPEPCNRNPRISFDADQDGDSRSDKDRSPDRTSNSVSESPPKHSRITVKERIQTAAEKKQAEKEKVDEREERIINENKEKIEHQIERQEAEQLRPGETYGHFSHERIKNYLPCGMLADWRRIIDPRLPRVKLPSDGNQPRGFEDAGYRELLRKNYVISFLPNHIIPQHCIVFKSLQEEEDQEMQMELRRNINVYDRYQMSFKNMFNPSLGDMNSYPSKMSQAGNSFSNSPGLSNSFSNSFITNLSNEEDVNILAREGYIQYAEHLKQKVKLMTYLDKSREKNFLAGKSANLNANQKEQQRLVLERINKELIAMKDRKRNKVLQMQLHTQGGFIMSSSNSMMSSNIMNSANARRDVKIPLMDLSGPEFYYSAKKRQYLDAMKSSKKLKGKVQAIADDRYGLEIFKDPFASSIKKQLQTQTTENANKGKKPDHFDEEGLWFWNNDKAYIEQEGYLSDPTDGISGDPLTKTMGNYETGSGFADGRKLWAPIYESNPNYISPLNRDYVLGTSRSHLTSKVSKFFWQRPSEVYRRNTNLTVEEKLLRQEWEEDRRQKWEMRKKFGLSQLTVVSDGGDYGRSKADYAADGDTQGDDGKRSSAAGKEGSSVAGLTGKRRGSFAAAKKGSLKNAGKRASRSAEASSGASPDGNDGASMSGDDGPIIRMRSRPSVGGKVQVMQMHGSDGEKRDADATVGGHQSLDSSIPNSKDARKYGKVWLEKSKKQKNKGGKKERGGVKFGAEVETKAFEVGSVITPASKNNKNVSVEDIVEALKAGGGLKKKAHHHNHHDLQKQEDSDDEDKSQYDLYSQYQLGTTEKSVFLTGQRILIHIDTSQLLDRPWLRGVSDNQFFADLKERRIQKTILSSGFLEESKEVSDPKSKPLSDSNMTSNNDTRERSTLKYGVEAVKGRKQTTTENFNSNKEILARLKETDRIKLFTDFFHQFQLAEREKQLAIINISRPMIHSPRMSRKMNHTILHPGASQASYFHQRKFGSKDRAHSEKTPRGGGRKQTKFNVHIPKALAPDSNFSKDDKKHRKGGLTLEATESDLVKHEGRSTFYGVHKKRGAILDPKQCRGSFFGMTNYHDIAADPEEDLRETNLAGLALLADAEDFQGLTNLTAGSAELIPSSAISTSTRKSSKEASSAKSLAGNDAPSVSNANVVRRSMARRQSEAASLSSRCSLFGGNTLGFGSQMGSDSLDCLVDGASGFNPRIMGASQGLSRVMRPDPLTERVQALVKNNKNQDFQTKAEIAKTKKLEIVSDLMKPEILDALDDDIIRCYEREKIEREEWQREAEEKERQRIKREEEEEKQRIKDEKERNPVLYAKKKQKEQEKALKNQTDAMQGGGSGNIAVFGEGSNLGKSNGPFLGKSGDSDGDGESELKHSSTGGEFLLDVGNEFDDTGVSRKKSITSSRPNQHNLESDAFQEEDDENGNARNSKIDGRFSVVEFRSPHLQALFGKNPIPHNVYQRALNRNLTKRHVVKTQVNKSLEGETKTPYGMMSIASRGVNNHDILQMGMNTLGLNTKNAGHKIEDLIISGIRTTGGGSDGGGAHGNNKSGGQAQQQQPGVVPLLDRVNDIGEKRGGIIAFGSYNKVDNSNVNSNRFEGLIKDPRKMTLNEKITNFYVKIIDTVVGDPAFQVANVEAIRSVMEEFTELQQYEQLRMNEKKCGATGDDEPMAPMNSGEIILTSLLNDLEVRLRGDNEPLRNKDKNLSGLLSRSGMDHQGPAADADEQETLANPSGNIAPGRRNSLTMRRQEVDYYPSDGHDFLSNSPVQGGWSMTNEDTEMLLKNHATSVLNPNRLDKMDTKSKHLLHDQLQKLFLGEEINLANKMISIQSLRQIMGFQPLLPPNSNKNSNNSVYKTGKKTGGQEVVVSSTRGDKLVKESKKKLHDKLESKHNFLSDHGYFDVHGSDDGEDVVDGATAWLENIKKMRLQREEEWEKEGSDDVDEEYAHEILQSEQTSADILQVSAAMAPSTKGSLQRSEMKSTESILELSIPLGTHNDQADNDGTSKLEPLQAKEDDPKDDPKDPPKSDSKSEKGPCKSVLKQTMDDSFEGAVVGVETREKGTKKTMKFAEARDETMEFDNSLPAEKLLDARATGIELVAAVELDTEVNATTSGLCDSDVSIPSDGYRTDGTDGPRRKKVKRRKANQGEKQINYQDQDQGGDDQVPQEGVSLTFESIRKQRSFPATGRKTRVTKKSRKNKKTFNHNRTGSNLNVYAHSDRGCCDSGSDTHIISTKSSGGVLAGQASRQASGLSAHYDEDEKPIVGGVGLGQSARLGHSRNLGTNLGTSSQSMGLSSRSTNRAGKSIPISEKLGKFDTSRRMGKIKVDEEVEEGVNSDGEEKKPLLQTNFFEVSNKKQLQDQDDGGRTLIGRGESEEGISEYNEELINSSDEYTEDSTAKLYRENDGGDLFSSPYWNFLRRLQERTNAKINQEKADYTLRMSKQAGHTRNLMGKISTMDFSILNFHYDENSKELYHNAHEREYFSSFFAREVQNLGTEILQECYNNQDTTWRDEKVPEEDNEGTMIIDKVGKSTSQLEILSTPSAVNLNVSSIGNEKLSESRVNVGSLTPSSNIIMISGKQFETAPTTATDNNLPKQSPRGKSEVGRKNELKIKEFFSEFQTTYTNEDDVANEEDPIKARALENVRGPSKFLVVYDARNKLKNQYMIDYIMSKDKSGELTKKAITYKHQLEDLYLFGEKLEQSPYFSSIFNIDLHSKNCNFQTTTSSSNNGIDKIQPFPRDWRFIQEELQYSAFDPDIARANYRIEEILIQTDKKMEALKREEEELEKKKLSAIHEVEAAISEGTREAARQQAAKHGLIGRMDTGLLNSMLGFFPRNMPINECLRLQGEFLKQLKEMLDQLVPKVVSQHIKVENADLMMFRKGGGEDNNGQKKIFGLKKEDKLPPLVNVTLAVKSTHRKVKSCATMSVWKKNRINLKTKYHPTTRMLHIQIYMDACKEKRREVIMRYYQICRGDYEIKLLKWEAKIERAWAFEAKKPLNPGEVAIRKKKIFAQKKFITYLFMIKAILQLKEYKDQVQAEDDLERSATEKRSSARDERSASKDWDDRDPGSGNSVSAEGDAKWSNGGSRKSVVGQTAPAGFAIPGGNCSRTASMTIETKRSGISSNEGMRKSTFSKDGGLQKPNKITEKLVSLTHRTRLNDLDKDELISLLRKIQNKRCRLKNAQKFGIQELADIRSEFESMQELKMIGRLPKDFDHTLKKLAEYLGEYQFLAKKQKAIQDDGKKTSKGDPKFMLDHDVIHATDKLTTADKFTREAHALMCASPRKKTRTPASGGTKSNMPKPGDPNRDFFAVGAQEKSENLAAFTLSLFDGFSYTKHERDNLKRNAKSFLSSLKKGDKSTRPGDLAHNARFLDSLLLIGMARKRQLFKKVKEVLSKGIDEVVDDDSRAVAGMSAANLPGNSQPTTSASNATDLERQATQLSSKTEDAQVAKEKSVLSVDAAIDDIEFATGSPLALNKSMGVVGEGEVSMVVSDVSGGEEQRPTIIKQRHSTINDMSPNPAFQCSFKLLGMEATESDDEIDDIIQKERELVVDEAWQNSRIMRKILIKNPLILKTFMCLAMKNRYIRIVRQRHRAAKIVWEFLDAHRSQSYRFFFKAYTFALHAIRIQRMFRKFRFKNACNIRKIMKVWRKMERSIVVDFLKEQEQGERQEEGKRIRGHAKSPGAEKSSSASSKATITNAGGKSSSANGSKPNGKSLPMGSSTSTGRVRKQDDTLATDGAMRRTQIGGFGESKNAKLSKDALKRRWKDRIISATMTDTERLTFLIPELRFRRWNLLPAMREHQDAWKIYMRKLHKWHQSKLLKDQIVETQELPPQRTTTGHTTTGHAIGTTSGGDIQHDVVSKFDFFNQEIPNFEVIQSEAISQIGLYPPECPSVFPNEKELREMIKRARKDCTAWKRIPKMINQNELMEEKALNKKRKKMEEILELKKRLREVEFYWAKLMGDNYDREEQQVLKHCANLTSLTIGDHGFISNLDKQNQERRLRRTDQKSETTLEKSVKQSKKFIQDPESSDGGGAFKMQLFTDNEKSEGEQSNQNVGGNQKSTAGIKQGIGVEEILQESGVVLGKQQSLQANQVTMGRVTTTQNNNQEMGIKKQSWGIRKNQSLVRLPRLGSSAEVPQSEEHAKRQEQLQADKERLMALGVLDNTKIRDIEEKIEQKRKISYEEKNRFHKQLMAGLSRKPAAGGTDNFSREGMGGEEFGDVSIGMMDSQNNGNRLDDLHLDGDNLDPTNNMGEIASKKSRFTTKAFNTDGRRSTSSNLVDAEDGVGDDALGRTGFAGADDRMSDEENNPIADLMQQQPIQPPAKGLAGALVSSARRQNKQLNINIGTPGEGIDQIQDEQLEQFGQATTLASIRPSLYPTTSGNEESLGEDESTIITSGGQMGRGQQGIFTSDGTKITLENCFELHLDREQEDVKIEIFKMRQTALASKKRKNILMSEGRQVRPEGIEISEPELQLFMTSRVPAIEEPLQKFEGVKLLAPLYLDPDE